MSFTPSNTPQPLEPSTSSNAIKQGLLRVALIGVTGFAKVHLEMIKDGESRGLIQLVATTIINPEEEPEICADLTSSGVKIYQNYREMLGEMHGQVDLCFIPTGIHWHAPMTIAALEAGANVLVEKPAAATVQDIDAMQAAAKRANRFVAVGYQHMYAPETLTIKQAILAGRIGQLHAIKCLGLWPRPQSYYERNNWAGRLRLHDQWLLDSPFNNAMSHQLNLMCFLAGPKLEVSAQVVEVEAELYRARDIESPDTACLRGLSSNDVSIYFFGSHSSRAKSDPVIRVIGEHGHIEWDFAKTLILPNKGPAQTIVNQPIPEVRSAIIDTLASLCAGQGGFICDLSLARAQTLMTNGAHESSPVHPIPHEYVEYEKSEGDRWCIVSNIDSLLNQCFREEKLLSEVGCPWAQANQIVNLRGYERFPLHQQKNVQQLADTV